MKRYKLKKDLPTFKAGDEFYLDSNNDLRLKKPDIMAYSHITLEKFPNILKDWFEEIPENKRWRAEYGGEYAYIADDGLVSFDNDRREYTDNYRYRTGNYARVGDPRSLVEHKEYNTARQTLLDDAEGGEFSYDEDNWCACYSKTFHKWVSITGNTYYPGTIYFKTREALEESLKNHNNQWTVVRKYETGEEQMIKMLKITKELDGDIRIVQGRMELRIEKDKWDKMTDEQRTSKFNYDAIVVEGYLIEDNETKERLGQEPFVVEEYIV